MITDPQGDPIPEADARTCIDCGVVDHKDGGKVCEACDRWAHDNCGYDCGEGHFLCMECVYKDRCPVCSDIRSEDETRVWAGRYR